MTSPMASEHYADDLEALLDQALSEDFSVQLEDGSAILVAKQLVTTTRQLHWRHDVSKSRSLC